MVDDFGYYGPLAQLVEQLTLNQLVVGSIPTRPTNFPNQSCCTRPSEIAMSQPKTGGPASRSDDLQTRAKIRRPQWTNFCEVDRLYDH
jgi:hypothetical protein